MIATGCENDTTCMRKNAFANLGVSPNNRGLFFAIRPVSDENT